MNSGWAICTNPRWRGRWGPRKAPRHSSLLVGQVGCWLSQMQKQCSATVAARPTCVQAPSDLNVSPASSRHSGQSPRISLANSEVATTAGVVTAIVSAGRNPGMRGVGFVSPTPTYCSGMEPGWPIPESPTRALGGVRPTYPTWISMGARGQPKSSATMNQG